MTDITDGKGDVKRDIADLRALAMAI